MVAPPAKRSPDGYVAQRMFPDNGGDRGPWILCAVNPDTGDLFVKRLADDAVADWPDLRG